MLPFPSYILVQRASSTFHTMFVFKVAVGCDFMNANLSDDPCTTDVPMTLSSFTAEVSECSASVLVLTLCLLYKKIPEEDRGFLPLFFKSPCSHSR